MTEEEAKTKWCPFVRLGGPMQTEGEGTTSNRWPGDDCTKPASVYLCIGSACMAWRWQQEKQTVAFLEAVAAHMRTQAKPNFNTATQAVYAETGGKFARIEGGCGLAGSPQ